MKSYLCMMGVRLIELQRVMKPTASIYLHCDPTASHYLKLLMDSVFGVQRFKNEVVWCYKSGGASRRQFARKHDILLFYAKDQRQCSFNVLKVKSYGQTGGGQGGAVKYYKDEIGTYSMVNARDWWEISMLSTTHSERIGYPTQKPITLLDRVIQASSNPGDVVLDPFCGCATACVAADNLQREWVGIDISPKAVELVHMRLRDTLGGLYHAGMVTARTDIPMRTDIEVPIPYRMNKHVLFGQQEGLCAGCRSEFPYRAFEVDHVIPQSRGGTDHIDNLQLLCSSCNRIKGNRTMEYLMARLAEFRQTA